MNELIKISDKQTVSARELYEKLGFNFAHWARWTELNIKQNQFAIAGQDYEGFTTVVNGNQTQDYQLSIDFAKRLAMMAKTEKGELVRNYFIEVEKRYQSQSPKSPAELIAAGYQAALQLIEDMKPKAASFDSLISADGLYTVSDAAKILNYDNAGPKKIFKVLEAEGFLFYKAGWCVYQLYINDGYFVMKTRKVNFGDSNPDIYNQVFVTPKGLDMLDKHFGRNGFKKLVDK